MKEERIDVDKAILSLIGKLKRNPLIVYSEADLQTLLSSELSIYDKTYPTKGEFETNRVHREIPYCKTFPQDRESHKFDIAIFSDQDIHRVNANLGRLYVEGQYADGTTEKKSKKEKVKRATFCSHLIELKVPPRSTIKFTTQDKQKINQTILYDFTALRSGYKSYKFFMKEYNIKTKLYFFCYVIWDSHDKTKKENQVGEFKKAYDNALNIPEKINFYLLIGPKNEWEDYFLKDNSLDKYLDNFIYFF
ncbi:MAG TPA: hypothetical protein ENI29_18555 [bacterium]|nr:hypothetical protein [bacterium]